MKFAISQCIMYFREDMTVKHIHVGIATDKNQGEFMIKRENKPYQKFTGKWP